MMPPRMAAWTRRGLFGSRRPSRQRKRSTTRAVPSISFALLASRNDHRSRPSFNRQRGGRDLRLFQQSSRTPALLHPGLMLPAAMQPEVLLRILADERFQGRGEALGQGLDRIGPAGVVLGQDHVADDQAVP